VIVTADHGHYLVIEDADRFVEAGKQDETGQKQQNPALEVITP
jgi:alkaline phosphatase